MLPVFRSLALGSLPLALLACALDRPEGAYVPKVRAPAADAGKRAMADSDEDIYGEMNGKPQDAPSDSGDDNDRSGDAAPAAGRDAAVAPGKRDAAQPTEPEPDPDLDPEPDPDAPDAVPAENVAGDYWMRADVDADSSVSALGLTLRTNTKSQVYSLVRVDQQDGKRTFRDFQCTLRITQSCSAGCTSLSTTLLDPVKSARAFVPAVRDLTVAADGSWSASRVPYAVGWKGDFASDPALRLPTSDSDPLVYDPDGGRGKGIDLTVRLKPSIIPERVCEFRVVQKIDVSYAGKLEGGALRSGTMADRGSTQNVLETTCPDSEPSSSEGSTAPVRLIVAPRPIETAALPWPCPSLSEFEAAFR